MWRKYNHRNLLVSCYKKYLIHVSAWHANTYVWFRLWLHRCSGASRRDTKPGLQKRRTGMMPPDQVGRQQDQTKCPKSRFVTSWSNKSRPTYRWPWRRWRGRGWRRVTPRDVGSSRTQRSPSSSSSTSYLKTVEIYDNERSIWKLCNSMIYRRLGGGVAVCKLQRDLLFSKSNEADNNVNTLNIPLLNSNIFSLFFKIIQNFVQIIIFLKLISNHNHLLIIHRHHQIQTTINWIQIHFHLY